MGLTAKGPKLFTCPKCRKAYLGHGPLPDCPGCGFDYRVKSGFRWDVLVYVLSILGLVSYLLISSSYRTLLTGTISRGDVPAFGEKLPGAGQPPVDGRDSRDAGR